MKRTATAILWFLAVWTAAAALAMFEGWPALVAPVAGLIVGALVWADPGEWLWKASSDEAIRRRRLADLDRVPESSMSTDTQRETEPAEG